MNPEGSPHWRTAVILGAPEHLADLIEGLTTVARARGTSDPIDPEWDPTDAAALWLHGVEAVAIEGRPWGWTLLRPRRDAGPVRPLQDLRPDIVCVVHPAERPWTPKDTHALTALAGSATACVLFTRPMMAPGATLGANTLVFSSALEGASEEASLWELAPEAADGLPMLSELLAAWDAAPGVPRDVPEPRPGARLLCATCGDPVTDPVLCVSEEENVAVLAHDRLSRGNEWIGPGLCLSTFSTDARDRYWFVEPLHGPVTMCSHGHDLGHRTTHLTGGQGELDSREWRVAALRRDRVVWEGTAEARR